MAAASVCCSSLTLPCRTAMAAAERRDGPSCHTLNGMTAATMAVSLPSMRQVCSSSSSAISSVAERRSSSCLLCSMSGSYGGGGVSLRDSFGLDVDHTAVAMAPSRHSARSVLRLKELCHHHQHHHNLHRRRRRSCESVKAGTIANPSSIAAADICVARWKLTQRSLANGRKRSVQMAAGIESTTTSTPTLAGKQLKLASGLLKVVTEECKEDAELTAAMLQLFSHVQLAVKSVSSVVSRASLEGLMGFYEDGEHGGGSGGERDKQKKLDVVANNILKRILSESGVVSVLASEEEDEPILVAGGGKYVVVFDPLDGSRNIDASIPTGIIFGVYERVGSTEPLLSGTGPLLSPPPPHPVDWSLLSVLQPGTDLIAAGYALFSSATMLVLSFGSGVHGFTLDPSLGEFLLTHPNIRIPRRGQIYSLNDGRYFDWPQGLRNYIDDIRQGKGQNPNQYSARYICSLVADVHRTLLYGGIAMNPRSHLRLVYEANPMSFIVEQAGGKASDGKRRILEIRPSKLHERLPLFLGSFDDVSELESYGDVQQAIYPGYKV